MPIFCPPFALNLSALPLIFLPAAAYAAPNTAALPPAPAASIWPPTGTDADTSTSDGVLATPQREPTEPKLPPPPARPATRAHHIYPQQADGQAITLGGYTLSRWAEDWRGLRDPAKRKDWIDRLKYIPIDSRGDIYVTLSGEIRLRINDYSDPGLLNAGYRLEEQTRVVGGADLHIGPIRFYGELGHGGLSGHNYGTPLPKSRDALVAQQFFAEVSGAVGNYGAGVRYGRQQFTDGSVNLVSQIDNNTIHTSVQGIRGWAQGSSIRADLFDFKKVALGVQGLGDDHADDGTRFSGATLGMVFANAATRKLFLDPFIWRERNNALKWGSVMAREIRYYYGARLWGNFDRLALDWTIDHQDGSFNGRDISAWNAFIAQTYVLDPKHWKPKIGIHFDFGDGGGSFGKGTLHTAKAPFAGTIAYSYQGALNFTNLFQVSPNFTVSPSRKLDVLTEFQHSWRVSPHDAVYRGLGTAYAGSETVPGRDVGDALRLQATWKMTRRVSIVGRYEYFAPGAILDRLGYGDSHFLAGWISYRF
jgi:hypothetical protein